MLRAQAPQTLTRVCAHKVVVVRAHPHLRKTPASGELTGDEAAALSDLQRVLTLEGLGWRSLLVDEGLDGRLSRRSRADDCCRRRGCKPVPKAGGRRHAGELILRRHVEELPLRDVQCARCGALRLTSLTRRHDALARRCGQRLLQRRQRPARGSSVRDGRCASLRRGVSATTVQVLLAPNAAHKSVSALARRPVPPPPRQDKPRSAAAAVTPPVAATRGSPLLAVVSRADAGKNGQGRRAAVVAGAAARKRRRRSRFAQGRERRQSHAFRALGAAGVRDGQGSGVGGSITQTAEGASLAGRALCWGGVIPIAKAAFAGPKIFDAEICEGRDFRASAAHADAGNSMRRLLSVLGHAAGSVAKEWRGACK